MLHCWFFKRFGNVWCFWQKQLVYEFTVEQCDEIRIWLFRRRKMSGKLIECARHKYGWLYDWRNVRNLMKYDRLISAYKVKVVSAQRT